ncbi:MULTISPECIES: hypothetical protein [unclassified Clostridium]|nr:MULTISPECIES: hypothetical protein [unclassified Clostridium]EHI97431.1 hypothetical protein CDLVIII_0706 [Clostridium sp. DL-VIII]OOM74021.1 hypothetical protein CLOBL_44950 [Clostridium sp. BL-8]
MERSINIFSAILLKLFSLVSKSRCGTIWGEPDYPEDLLK